MRSCVRKSRPRRLRPSLRRRLRNGVNRCVLRSRRAQPIQRQVETRVAPQAVQREVQPVVETVRPSATDSAAAGSRPGAAQADRAARDSKTRAAGAGRDPDRSEAGHRPGGRADGGRIDARRSPTRMRRSRTSVRQRLMETQSEPVVNGQRTGCSDCSGRRTGSGKPRPRLWSGRRLPPSR